MTIQMPVFKSRWGFHPCDYNLFVKLRSLHKWYWQTMYDFHRWHRWWRKEPQNRPGPEPPYCKLFVVDQPWSRRYVRGDEVGWNLYPRSVVDRDIVALYRQARTPSDSPAEPFDAETRQRIESLYEEAAQHFTA